MWERRYVVIRPQRTSTNIRYYSEEDRKKILNISMLKQAGFKISKIVELSDKDLFMMAVESSVESEEPEIIIETLVLTMLFLEENGFLQVLSGIIDRVGIEKTFDKVLLPFLAKMGVLCDYGTINPVQKSFIFNLIRQKIIIAIDDEIGKTKEIDGSRIIFFMPKNIGQETCLLFYSLFNFRKLDKILINR